MKHSGHLVREDLDASQLQAPEPHEDLVALDEALTLLAKKDPTAANLVHLRYFGGLTIGEVALILRISSRTADRLWSYARAWLRREMGEPDEGTELRGVIPVGISHYPLRARSKSMAGGFAMQT